MPAGAEICGDCAFVSEELETLAREQEGVEMCECLRRDSARRQCPEVEARKHRLRHPVEAAFSGLLSHFGRHIRAVTWRGFQLKALLFVLAHSLRKGCHI